MTIRALDTANPQASVTVGSAVTRLRALIDRIRKQLRENEAQARLQMQLDRLDDARLADIGLVRRGEQVGWRSNISGAEPVAVIRVSYEARAPETIR